MAADFPRLKDKVFERYPMMRSTAFERRMLFERAGGPAPKFPIALGTSLVPES
jgi:hypothetical protein